MTEALMEALRGLTEELADVSMSEDDACAFVEECLYDLVQDGEVADFAVFADPKRIDIAIKPEGGEPFYHYVIQLKETDD